MFLVVWTTKHGEDQDPWFKDHWVAEESYVDAEKTYEGYWMTRGYMWRRFVGLRSQRIIL
jgi:hypothetical protein